MLYKSFINRSQAIALTLIFITISLTPVFADISIAQTSDKNVILQTDQQELDLLAAEILFDIRATGEVTSQFNVSYSIPPIYCDQTPIIIDIKNDTDAKIVKITIINDSYQPNKKINFTIKPMQKDEKASFHFIVWVLVKNNEYKDLPGYVEIPKKEDLPENTKIWLESTNAVQKDNFLIKRKARVLNRFTNDNLNKLAKKIASFTHNHRKYLLYYYSPIPKFQDAVWSYIFGGVCTGRANLGAALFRANNIPARQIAVMPTWNKDMWYDMHYITQYFSPGYGWILTETSLGITPYQPKNNIIMRVNYPKDENKAGNWHTIGTGGVEYWFWDNHKNISFLYDHKISRRGWIENEIQTNTSYALNTFNLTKKVNILYNKYYGVNLTGINQQYYINATQAQQNAVDAFKQSEITAYTANITYAYDQYKNIDI